jgi:O-antigen/teichoic acid export membrane protein
VAWFAKRLGGVDSTSVGWRDMLSFGATVQVTNAFITGQQNAARFLLGMLTQLALVAQFELGARVATALWSIPTLIQGAVIPEAARASASPGTAGLRAVYVWGCRWIFVATGLLMGGLWLTAPALFVLWLGPGHDASAQIARGLVFAFVAATLAGPATAVARGGGWPRMESVALGSALLLNILLSMVLIPRAGAAGAVLALGISYALASAGLLIVFHRRIQVASIAWGLRLPVPRLGAAALCAGAVWLATRSLGHDTRLDALRTVTIQGGTFTILYAAAGSLTGDTRAIWERTRALWKHSPERAAHGA